MLQQSKNAGSGISENLQTAIPDSTGRKLDVFRLISAQITSNPIHPKRLARHANQKHWPRFYGGQADIDTIRRDLKRSVRRAFYNRHPAQKIVQAFDRKVDLWARGFPFAMPLKNGTITRKHFLYGGHQWIAANITARPIMAEEDVLYENGLAACLETVLGDKQFIILGDTDHRNPQLRIALNHHDTFQALAACGTKHVCLEFSTQLASIVTQLSNGTITKADFVEKFVAMDIKRYGKTEEKQRRSAEGAADTILTIKKAGMHVHAVDCATILHPETRLEDDKKVAARIKSCVGSERTAIIYGAMHGAYEGGLDDHLGHDNILRLNVHPSLEHYRKNPAFSYSYIDHQPRYLWITDTDTVIQAPPNYGRKVDIVHDHMQRHLRPEVAALWQEMESFKEELMQEWITSTAIAAIQDTDKSQGFLKMKLDQYTGQPKEPPVQKHFSSVARDLVAAKSPIFYKKRLLDAIKPWFGS